MTWKDVIGVEREQRLLELVVKIALDTRAEWMDLFDGNCLAPRSVRTVIRICPPA
jgi:hypothetical protein